MNCSPEGTATRLQCLIVARELKEDVPHAYLGKGYIIFFSMRVS
jgi:hypothetical protein